MRWIVTSQPTKQFYPKKYEFTNKVEALMFLDMCRRDGDYHFEIREIQ